MDQDELNDLHEQAAQLSYLAITYDGLQRELSNTEWDALADEMGKAVVELILSRIDKKHDEIETQAVSEEGRQ